jgi:long-chain acyl-CoA synthetase
MNVAQRESVLPTQAGDERVICMMPLYHSFAAAMCLHLTAYAGGTLYIMPRYRPDWVVDTIKRHAITRLPAGPTVFNSLLAYDGLTQARVSSLRCAYSGSAPLAQDTLMRWEALTGVPIYEGYGQSEAGPVLTYHGPAMLLKQGSVGPPLPMTDIEIVDGADTGEIRARGPQIMAGYWNRAEETSATLIDGWLHTGDIGRIDTDGYVFIEDRKKDMAIVGGYNVYPREIDEVLMQLPGVREAGAIGVPDAYRGEVIWAYVAGDGLDDDIITQHCAALLVKYKQPAVIKFVESLPRTNVGKIDKKALKAMAEAALLEVANVA